MTDENSEESIQEQNRRKLEEHLAKLKTHGGNPPAEEKPSLEPDGQEEQQRFRQDWEKWKRAYQGRVIDLRAAPGRDPSADYALLGVSPGSSKDEIRRAFYRHAKENHPDQGGNVEKFRELMEAYTRLTGGN